MRNLRYFTIRDILVSANGLDIEIYILLDMQLKLVLFRSLDKWKRAYTLNGQIGFVFYIKDDLRSKLNYFFSTVCLKVNLLTDYMIYSTMKSDFC